MTDANTETAMTGCLLVVDDQEANIQVLGSMLGKLGFEVLPAMNGEQALKRLNARTPDLILLDLLMPEMNGFELCRKIQERPEWAEIPIIFLSAADDKNLIVRALESGGVDYITKPFSRTELVVRVRNQLVLKSARDRLKQLAEDKDELLGIITHYLQNHLAGMQMSSQMLLDRAQTITDPKLKLMAENIRHASTQMRGFVKALVANASADLGFSIKSQKVNLAEAASRITEEYKEAAARKEIRLEMDPASGPVVAVADPAALEQILDNLVSNAVKFSPRGKEIRVSVLARNSHVECRVKDQGPGCSEEDRTRMFRRYARLSARPTGNEPSTGLGLSIAKRLAVAMGGDLACDSGCGGGAEFVLNLPCEKPETN